MTLERIQLLLARVTFAPSCVDMNWQWEVCGVAGPDLRVGGWMIRTTFQRPDRDSGAMDRGFGRWWHLPWTVTDSGVVKTAFAASKMILEHELMESFRFCGVRIFDPHHDLDDLAAAAAHRAGAAT
jgi:hypothetical protein